MATETVPIPEPTGLPILGNITAIDSEFPLGSLLSLSDQYGEIYRLRFPGRTVVVVSTRALVNETSNEKRFKKSVNTALQALRRGIHDGLFTAMEGEENWGIAHRVLMPAFGPLSIRNMFDEMHDIASQLTLKWARYGPNSRIMVTDDFTRLTLDTLALCSMGFRFNSFYSPVMHPFIDAMAGFLVEAGNMSRRPPLPSLFYRSQDAKFATDIDVLRNTAKEVLESRKVGGESTRNDLLDAMLRGVDPKTGRKMSDESIMDNLITFLIAGHETTSGLLSFAFQELMKHPECYQKAQREVDQVVGKGTIKVEHLSKLPYINGVLRETLRVRSTIPSFTVEPYEDTVIGGKYFIKKGEVIVNLIAKSHLDPLVWGSDADEFKPERMLDAEFERISREFPNAWKPFGNGIRACIGRPFAWQEALLVMAMLLQNFNFVPDPSSGSGVKQTLTIKPKDMYMRAILRDGLTPTILERRLAGIPEPPSTTDATRGVADSSSNESAKDRNGGKGGLPMTVLFGSNSGTCEALARQIAGDAVRHGFRVVTVDCLDTAKDNIPKGQPVVIVTGSYEGQPPDNAGHFFAWMESLEKDKQPLKGISYAVFGCGHKDWVQTFHRIPKLVDDTFQDLGATRLTEIGLADVSGGEVFTNFETWEDEILWPALTARYSPGATTSGAITGGASARESSEKGGLKVRVSSPRVSTLRQDLHDATVVSARVLTKCGASDQEKRHIEIKLPDGVSYSAGDYLAVLPVNPRETVQRVMRRFHLAADAHLTIETEGPTTLPVGTSVPASELLGSYVELSQPATKRNLSTLAEHTGKDNAAKDVLTNLTGELYTEEVVAKRISVVDLLDRFPSIDLPIGTFLSMMPPMRVRQYSISSSPLWKPDHVTLTFTVLNKPALSGQGYRHVGVASTYLSSLQEGDTLHVSVRPSHAAFSLPSDPERTPLLCISAGTGLAPFRGFIQERAAMISAGRTLAPALLYFGCRFPDKDDLYCEEFDEWERLGAVKMRRAYSRKPEESLDCKHVQDRLWLEREEIADAWRQGAKVFVCGSRGVAEGAMDVGIKIKVASAKGKGEDLDRAQAREWLENMRNVRYATDVFD